MPVIDYGDSPLVPAHDLEAEQKKPEETGELGNLDTNSMTPKKQAAVSETIADWKGTLLSSKQTTKMTTK